MLDLTHERVPQRFSEPRREKGNEDRQMNVLSSERLAVLAVVSLTICQKKIGEVEKDMCFVT